MTPPAAFSLVVPAERDMEALGGRLAGAATAALAVHLSGVLGAGKTTLVRGYLRALGYTGAVKSPTFTLVESYACATREIHHFDLFRIGDPEELYFLGFEDYLAAGCDCFIEWPERARERLPLPDLRIDIAVEAALRRVRVAAGSSAGQQLIENLSESTLVKTTK